jgi:outer membrane receptor protein involved in Fe transport
VRQAALAHGLVGLCLVTALPAVFAAVPQVSPEPRQSDDLKIISEVVVTAQRRRQSRMLHAGNIDRLDRAALEQAGHQHVSELLGRVAGVWIVRGSGQEHQTSIRSPVPTGGGACANFMVLEDGIPVRPAGFCNVNQLAEVNIAQANAVEVIRGPGNALFGSNALHGIVNVLMPDPGGGGNPHLALETGAHDYYRISAAIPFSTDAPWLALADYTDDGGFRDDSGFRLGKLHFKRRWQLSDGEFTAAFSASDLDQETAGFIHGLDSYRDPAVNRSNPNPEAFRAIRSQRLYGIWTHNAPRFDLDVRPYIRHSDMRFMHHALPGKPVEENGHVSAGLVSTATFTPGGNSLLMAGLDLEWSDMFLRQTQTGLADGPPARRETRPQGRHYDYGVAAISMASYLQADFRLGERLSLGAGLRVEYSRYDYDNHMLAGNTREDGTSCGFDGCLYSRPADRTDHFTNLAPKLSASYRLNARNMIFASAASGFRAPQALELYRLQNGQQVADLDSERIASVEAGWRSGRKAWSAEVTVFAMRKRDSVFRDAEGFNVTGARSRHIGVEASIDWQVSPEWQISIDSSYARHAYDFTYLSGRGVKFIAGRDIDTAPRWLGNAGLEFRPAPWLRLGLQWRVVGDYYLDAENRFRYPGHELLNLRTGLRLSPEIDLVLRLNNVMGTEFADRADYASGKYRYLPGRGREMFAELRYTPLRSPRPD